MWKTEKKDGKRAGDQKMKITKGDLKNMILKTLKEAEAPAPAPETDPTKAKAWARANSLVPEWKLEKPPPLN